MKKQKTFTLRINGEILKKFHYISQYEGLSASGNLLHFITKSVREFEKEHGVIDLSDENDG